MHVCTHVRVHTCMVCLINRDFPAYLWCLEGARQERQWNWGFVTPTPHPRLPTYPTALN